MASRSLAQTTASRPGARPKRPRVSRSPSSREKSFACACQPVEGLSPDRRSSSAYARRRTSPTAVGRCGWPPTKADPASPAPEEVPDHVAGRGLVVDGHVVGRTGGQRLAQEHQGRAVRDRGEVIRVEDERGEDDAVDPVPRIAFRGLTLVRRPPAGLVDQHGVAAHRPRGDDLVRQGPEVRLVHPRHRQGQDVAAPAPQLSSGQRRPIVQLGNGRPDALPSLVGDVRPLVHHVGDGLEGDAGQCGDVLEPRAGSRLSRALRRCAHGRHPLSPGNFASGADSGSARVLTLESLRCGSNGSQPPTALSLTRKSL